MNLGNTRVEEAPFTQSSSGTTQSPPQRRARGTVRKGSGQRVVDAFNKSDRHLTTFGAHYGRAGLRQQQTRERARAAVRNSSQARNPHDATFTDRPRLSLARKRSTLSEADDNAVSEVGEHPPEWVSTVQLACARSAGSVAKPRTGSVASIRNDTCAQRVPEANFEHSGGFSEHTTVHEQSYGQREPGASANAHKRNMFTDSHTGDLVESNWKPRHNERAAQKREEVELTKPREPPKAAADSAAFSLLLTRHSKRAQPELYETVRMRRSQRNNGSAAASTHAHESEHEGIESKAHDFHEADGDVAGAEAMDAELPEASKAKARNRLRKQGLL